MLSPPADSDGEIVAAARQAWQRLRRHASWQDWRAVLLALRIGRDHALAVAKTDTPFGKRYVRAFAAWLRQHELDSVSKQVRGVAIKVADNLTAVEAWRSALPEAAQLKLNHPNSIWSHYQKSRRGFGTDTACTHKPSRHFVIFPCPFKERARRRIVKVLETHGPDPCRLAEAALSAAIAHVEDIEELARYQAPRPLGRPSLKTRPRSPSAINADTAALSLRPFS